MIGSNIKAWRKQRKITQYQLAEKTNLSRSYVADVERGRYNPSLETLDSIAKALNVKISDLMEYNGNNPDPHGESELADIPIEKLNQYTLTYKGHTLSKEEADDVIELLEAALKRWKK